MDWEWWKGAAAIWGAGLSTAIACSRILPEVPNTYFGPSRYGDDVFTLYIRNASELPLQISSFSIFRIKGKKAEYQPIRLEEDRDSKKIRVFRNNKGSFNVFTPKGEEFALELFNIEENSIHLIVLWWHRHSLFPSLPYFRLARGKRLWQMNGISRA